MMKRLLSLLALIVMLTGMLGACGGQQTTKPTATKEPTAAATTEATTGASATVAVTGTTEISGTATVEITGTLEATGTPEATATTEVTTTATAEITTTAEVSGTATTEPGAGTEIVNNEGGFAVTPPEGWEGQSQSSPKSASIMLQQKGAIPGEALSVFLTSGPIADIPITGTVSLDAVLDAFAKTEGGPKLSTSRENSIVGGLDAIGADFSLTQGKMEASGHIIAILLDEKRAFLVMGMAAKDKWDATEFGSIVDTIRFFEPGTEKPATATGTPEADITETPVVTDTAEMTSTAETTEMTSTAETTEMTSTAETMEMTSTAEMDVTPETVTAAPEDTLGVVEVKKGDPIVLAYALVTTGDNSNLGIDSMRGIEIALADRGGEIFGHPVKLIGEDTGCSSEGGQAAGNKLITNDQIVAIVGTTCSSEARVMAPVIDQAGLVMISPSNTAPELTDPAKHVEGYLRTAHNDKVQGALAAEFAYTKLGLKKAATIHDGSVYAEQLANVFAEKFKELGGEIVTQEAVNKGDTNMQPVLTKIASLKPEMIYYPIFLPEGGFITRQVKEIAGLKDVALMAADGLFNPDFVKAAGESSVGVYLSSPDLTSLGKAYEDFLTKHQEKYNEAPLSVYHANAYDATTLIIDSIKKVAKVDDAGTLYIPRQALRDALYATKNYKGLTGNLTCDENGDCADPHIVVYQVDDSDTTTWKPGSATGSNPKKVYP